MKTKKAAIFSTFKQTVEKFNLIEGGDQVLLAYSGGIDSTGLLLLLLEFQKERPFEISLAHFNHRLRPSADRDEEFCRQMARKYSLRFFVGRENVRSYAKNHGLNLEEAGRELRYRFLKEIAEKEGFTKIATAHTMNDQAETFLLRLMRGSGLRGLRGILPVAEAKIVRPLLEIERRDIASFLHERGITYCFDESNLDRRYLRNRIRLELVPYLENNYDKKAVSRLAKTALLLGEEEEFLEFLTEKEAEKAISERNGVLMLDGQMLASFPSCWRRRLLRFFLLRLKGNLRRISLKHIEALEKLKNGKEVHLGKNFVFRKEGGWIFLKKEQPLISNFQYLWDGKEILFIPEIGLRFQGKILKTQDIPSLQFDDSRRAYLAFELLRFPLQVRNRREGDRYQPLGTPGRKKLKEIMRAKNIPVTQRNRLPVFLSQGEIIWIPGLPVNEKFKITNSTISIYSIGIV